MSSSSRAPALHNRASLVTRHSAVCDSEGPTLSSQTCLFWTIRGNGIVEHVVLCDCPVPKRAAALGFTHTVPRLQPHPLRGQAAVRYTDRPRPPVRASVSGRGRDILIQLF